MKQFDIILNKLNELYKCKEPITRNHPIFIDFYKNLTDFFYNNNLSNSRIWYSIQNNIPTTSSTTITTNNLDNIFNCLDYIKRDLLIKKDDDKFWDYIHEDIKKVSYKNFKAEQYADSVENSFKLLETKIRVAYKAIKGEEKFGTDLMRRAFSEKQGCFIFENMETESGRNVQIGYMEIFSGAMQAIRNPKAHENLELSKEDAIDRIIFASIIGR